MLQVPPQAGSEILHPHTQSHSGSFVSLLNLPKQLFTLISPKYRKTTGDLTRSLLVGQCEKVDLLAP